MVSGIPALLYILHCIKTGVQVIGAFIFFSLAVHQFFLLVLLHFVGFSVGCKLLIVYPGSQTCLILFLTRRLHCLEFVLSVLYVLPDVVLYIASRHMELSLQWGPPWTRCLCISQVSEHLQSTIYGSSSRRLAWLDTACWSDIPTLVTHAVLPHMRTNFHLRVLTCT